MASKIRFPSTTVRNPSLKPSSLFGSSRSSSSASVNPGAGRVPSDAGLKPLSFSGKTVSMGIDFGKPSNVGASGTTTSTAGSEFGSLVSSLIGGSGSVLGLGSLVAGIAGLFGKSPAPPLVEFRLPGSIEDLLTVSGAGSSKSVTNTVTQAPVAPQPVQTTNVGLGAIAVNAVKQSLLSSGALGDVIASL